ncbi:MAG TPA: peptidoglycan-binding domain-containing protein, partial [Azospirillum sp.]
GPVGAVVGGAAGAGTGVAMDEGAETKVQEWTGIGDGAPTGQSGSSQRTAGADTRALSPQRVRNIQQALNNNGSDIAVDGVWGPNTRRALRDFQQANGLEATGQLDGRTVSALNIGQSQNSAGQSGGSGGTGGGPNSGTSSGTSSGGSGSGNPGNTGQNTGGQNTGDQNTGQPSRQ